MNSQTNELSLDAESTVSDAPARSLWRLGWQRLKKDKVGYISLFIVIFYLLLSLAGWMNLIGSDWREEIALPYAPPTFASWEKRGTEVKASSIQGVEQETLEADADDPLAALMAEADTNEDQYETETVQKADSLILGADGRGRDILTKNLKRYFSIGHSGSVRLSLCDYYRNHFRRTGWLFRQMGR